MSTGENVAMAGCLRRAAEALMKAADLLESEAAPQGGMKSSGDRVAPEPLPPQEPHPQEPEAEQERVPAAVEKPTAGAVPRATEDPTDDDRGILARRMGAYLAKGREAVAETRHAIGAEEIQRPSKCWDWAAYDRLDKWLSARGV